MALFWVLLGGFALVTSSAQDLQSTCSSALTQIGASKQSTQELAARCHASAPLQVCQEMRKALGERPWSFEEIDASCNIWRKAFETRSLQFKDIPVKTVDDAAEAKELPKTYEGISVVDVPAVPGLPGTADNDTTTPAVDSGNDTSNDTSNATVAVGVDVPDATTATLLANDTTDNATNDTNATVFPEMEGKAELPSILLGTSIASSASFVGAGLVLASLAAGAAFMLRRVRSHPVYQSRRSVEDGLE